jgi:hypothetical protein
VDPFRASSGALILVAGSAVSGATRVILRIFISGLLPISPGITLLHFGRPVGEVK